MMDRQTDGRTFEILKLLSQLKELNLSQKDKDGDVVHGIGAELRKSMD